MGIITARRCVWCDLHLSDITQAHDHEDRYCTRCRTEQMRIEQDAWERVSIFYDAHVSTMRLWVALATGMLQASPEGFRLMFGTHSIEALEAAEKALLDEVVEAGVKLPT